MGYTESFYDLSHGTDLQSAEEIHRSGFEVRGDAKSWCGKGVYFYDIKAKAWWSANRTCEAIKKQTGEKVKQAVIFVDIVDIKKDDIFDLRIRKDLEEFESLISPLLMEDALIVSGVEDETERKIILRSMLISFFAERKKKKLIIGNFRQRPQPLYEHAIEFANSLDMIFGIETIYCVKDTSVISNIRIGGSK